MTLSWPPDLEAKAAACFEASTLPCESLPHMTVAMDSCLSVLGNELDRAKLLLHDSPTEAIAQIEWSLRAVLKHSNPEKRDELIRVCREHSIHSCLLEDPYTRHAFQKPRGYPGDAALIDFCYGFNNPGPGESTLGLSIYRVMMNYPTVDSVRYRRGLIAHHIDQSSISAGRPTRIASVACGHMREAVFSRAVRLGRVGQYLGIDQDPVSLAEVDKTLGCLGVVSLKEDIVRIAIKGMPEDDLDFVYAAGLLDYLADKLAIKLIQAMTESLRCGGKALIANALPEIPERGYMECIMDWHLLYRSEEDLAALAVKAVGQSDYRFETFSDPMSSFAYCVITKI
jgi:hypothetical protein